MRPFHTAGEKKIRNRTSFENQFSPHLEEDVFIHETISVNNFRNSPSKNPLLARRSSVITILLLLLLL